MREVFVCTSHVGETINGFVVPDQLEATHERGVGPFGEKLGIHFIELSAEYSVAVMPVEGNEQPIGLLHGGAHCGLGEGMGSMAANVHARAKGRYAVGIDINATHTGSVRSGWVTGVCRALKLGGSMTVHEIVVSDAAGERLSTVRITNLLRERRD